MTGRALSFADFVEAYFELERYLFGPRPPIPPTPYAEARDAGRLVWQERTSPTDG